MENNSSNNNQFMESCQFNLVEAVASLMKSSGANRVKVETLDFKYDFREDPNIPGQPVLVSQKAVIRTYGRTVVVPLTDKLPTYEAAREYAVNKTRAYVQEYRQSQRGKAKAAAARRQRRHNQRKREAREEFWRRQ